MDEARTEQPRRRDSGHEIDEGVRQTDTEEECGSGDTKSLVCFSRHSVIQAAATPLHSIGADESSSDNNRHRSHRYPVNNIEPIQAPVLSPTSPLLETHCQISFQRSTPAPARRVSPTHAYPNCSRLPSCRRPVPCETWRG